MGSSGTSNLAAPKRRWFQWSLRTLFVVVTVLGSIIGWTVYQLNWIRQRHDHIARERSILQSRNEGTERERWTEYIFKVGWPAVHKRGHQWRGAVKPAPGALGPFGEKGLKLVVVYVVKQEVQIECDGSASISASHSKVLAAARLFPEATIRVFWYEPDNAGEDHPVTIQVDSI